MLFYKVDVTLGKEIEYSRKDNRDENDMFISELKEYSERFFRRMEKLDSSLFPKSARKGL